MNTDLGHVHAALGLLQRELQLLVGEDLASCHGRRLLLLPLRRGPYFPGTRRSSTSRSRLGVGGGTGAGGARRGGAPVGVEEEGAHLDEGWRRRVVRGLQSRAPVVCRICGSTRLAALLRLSPSMAARLRLSPSMAAVRLLALAGLPTWAPKRGVGQICCWSAAGGGLPASSVRESGWSRSERRAWKRRRGTKDNGHVGMPRWPDQWTRLVSFGVIR